MGFLARRHELVLYGAVVVFLFTFAYRNVFQLGVLAYGDAQPWNLNSQTSLSSFLDSWTRGGLGARANFGGLSLFEGLVLQVFENNYQLVQKLFLFSLLPFAYFACVILLRTMIKSRLVIWVASFAYSVNQLTLSEFLGGAQGLLLTYAALPLICHLALKLENRLTFRNFFAITFVLTLVTAFNAQAASIVFLVLLPAILSTYIGRKAPRSSLYLAGILAALVISETISLILILPQASSQLIAASSTDFLADYERLSPASILLFLGPTFVLLSTASIFSCKEKLVPLRNCFLIVAGAVLLFVYLGSRGLTTELFTLLPLLLVYRASVKLLYPLTFIFTLLTAFFLDSIADRQLSFGKPWRSLVKVARPLLIISVIFIPTLIFNNYQFLSGNLGLKSSTQLDPVFQEARTWLDSHPFNYYYRTLWLPQDIQTDYGVRAFDPDTFILPSGSVSNPSVSTPSVAYAKTVMEAIANGSDADVGSMLSYATVKYIIVNLHSPQMSSPHLQYDWLTYYPEGNPSSFLSILDTHEDLARVDSERDFVVYENTAFRPHVVAYDEVLVLKESSQEAAIRSSTTYTGNLVRNPFFNQNMTGWMRTGTATWNVDTRGAVQGTALQPWGFLAEDIPVNANTSYLFNITMRIQNAHQSHIKVEWFDITNNFLGSSFIQPGIDGTTNWFFISSPLFTPPHATFARLYLGAGGALSMTQAGLTWFSNPVLEQAFITIPYNPREFESLLSSKLVSNSSVVESSDRLDSSTFAEISKFVKTDLVLAGNGSPEFFDPSLSALASIAHTILVAGGVTNFSPVVGTWSSLPNPLSKEDFFATSQNGTISTVFKTTWSGLSRLTLRVVTGSTATTSLAGNSISPVRFTRDSFGFDWVDFESLNLSSGIQNLKVDLQGGIDQAFLYPIDNPTETLQQLVGPSNHFQDVKDTPTSNAVQINNNSGSIVFLGESYDHSWQATAGESILMHFAGLNDFSWGNSFLLPFGGNQTVTIQFVEQNQRNVLITIYFASWFVLCILLASSMLGDSLYARNLWRILLRRL